MTTIAVVDYGMGNRRSVEKALVHVGARALVSDRAEVLRAADGLVVPGVGAFPRGMANLRERGLAPLLLERLQAGVPILGICLGMQLFMDGSEELGGAEGLGWVAGGVGRLAPSGAEKLPHIGWNEVRWTAPSPLRAGLPENSAYYHVHTFVAVPEREQAVLARADYGGEFVTAVARPPFFGVQFHPEKSSLHGLRLLENFVASCAGAAVPAPATAAGGR